MHFEWILSPITQYTALALALCGCLTLFVYTKVEVRAVRLLAKQSVEAAGTSLQTLSAEVQEIREASRPSEVNQSSTQSIRTINLTKRGQALRMYSRGEPVHSIAAALQAPQNEIELMLKVHQLLNSPSSLPSYVPVQIQRSTEVLS